MLKETYLETLAFEEALKTVDAAVFAQASRHLRNIEVAVLKGAWQGQTYDQISADCGYAADYIKHDVGPKLWQLLSSSFGEKVNKNNLVAVILNHYRPIPQPVSPPSEPPFRPLPVDSALYIERPLIEARCFAEIQRSGALIRIKAPSQMGKTSLMIRILEQAKQHSTEAEPIYTIPLTLQQADQAVFSNLDQFLRWFCAAIARKLHLPNQVESYWNESFGSKSNCTAYFEDCILSVLNGSLVLAIDDVDAVFLHPEIADDFFALLRSWYEEAAYGAGGNALWQNFRLILVHSTEVYIPLDINQSPFNVGLAIELKELTYEQVAELAQRYSLNLSNAELTQLMQTIAGHPFLVQQAFYALSQQDLTLVQLLESAATDAGIYRNHLHRHLRSFQDYPALSAAYAQIIKAPAPVELDQLLAFQLHSMGLVTLQGNRVAPSCNLYRQYFISRELP